MGRVGRASTRRGKVLPVRAAAEEHDRGGVFAGWEDVGEHARRSHGEIDGLRDGEDERSLEGHRERRGWCGFIPRIQT